MREQNWQTPAEYQILFEKKYKAGEYPIKVIGKKRGSGALYTAIWEEFPTGEFYFYTCHGRTDGDYRQWKAEKVKAGFREIHHQRFEDGAGVTRNQATVVKP